MLISLNWIRDFVDLPADLDARALAERFTVTTAEVEGVEQVDDDWIIEVDNKSITHRPDLWGHYGIAREIAAMYGLPLKPYPVAPLDELQRSGLPEVPITIDDPNLCPRYSALRFSGVRAQASPLWMQKRLTHVGLRPIDILVDLTNYIMLELGQPMHAFDAKGIDRIEVAVAKDGEQFTTLDGVKRTMPSGTLMIQSNRRSVAIAGVMGGADTEVNSATTELLLESANFEPATIRRAATAMGHRTDASARFEKSLDPLNTVLAIRRFVHLAKKELPGLTLTSRLSDSFPNPPKTRTIRLDPRFASRYLGRPVSADQIEKILRPLEFMLKPVDGGLDVGVPSFRATKDITIEVDLVEEIARCLGYGTIDPTPPQVTVRYAEPDKMARLERTTLQLLCRGMSYAEVHRYIWFDDDWLRTIEWSVSEEDTISLKNPAAISQRRLRTTLIPGLLSSIDINRRNFDRFELLELGSAFFPLTGPHWGEDVEWDGKGDEPPYSQIKSTDPRLSEPVTPDREFRHLALAVVAPGRKAVIEDDLMARLKADLTTWAFQLFGESPMFQACDARFPWEHASKIATMELGNTKVGRLTVVPATLKRKIDEHLQAWSIAIAEIDLSSLVDDPHLERKLVPVPVYPQTQVDFSVLAPASRQYLAIEESLKSYDHPLLRRLAFVGSYEGGAVPAGQRSFTFRATLGDATRTLLESDIQQFRQTFIAYLGEQGLALRG